MISRRSKVVVALGLCLVVSCHKKESKPTETKTDETEAASSGEAPLEAPGSPNRFRLEGAESAAVIGAVASFSRGPDGSLRQLEIATSPQYQQQHKRSYVAYLYFPSGFEPKPGKYAIAADYRKRSDALGAGIVVQAQVLKLYAYEPKGDVTFTKFSDGAIAGRFHFSSQDVGRGMKEPRTITVSGQFEATASVSQKDSTLGASAAPKGSL